MGCWHGGGVLVEGCCAMVFLLGVVVEEGVWSGSFECVF